MDNNYESIVILVKELGKAVDTKIANAPFDRTVAGTIVRVDSATQYGVLISGKEYSISTKNVMNYILGQRVQVLIPQNDWNKIQMLEDTVGDGGISLLDKNYVHNQLAPSSAWSITHNLGKYPSVTVIDSSNMIVIGEVEYTSLNSVIVSFSSAFSGTAYLN